MQNVTVTVGLAALSGTGEEGKLPIKGHHKRNRRLTLEAYMRLLTEKLNKLFIQ
jgi:hypothetical protein